MGRLYLPVVFSRPSDVNREGEITRGKIELKAEQSLQDSYTPVYDNAISIVVSFQQYL